MVKRSTLQKNSPPSDIEAENNLIAAMLVSEQALEQNIERVTEDMFFNDLNRSAFRAIKQVYERGEEVNQITVAHESKDMGFPVSLSHLGEIILTLPTPEGSEYWLDYVITSSRLRNLMTTGAKIVELSSKTGADPKEIIQELETDLINLQNSVGMGDGTKTALDIAESMEEMLNEHLENPRKIRGYTTGYRSLDWVIDGLCKRSVYVLAAETSTGKSLFAHNLILNLASSGKRTALFSAEMGDVSILMRLLYMAAGVDRVAARTRGNYTEDEKLRLKNKLEVMKRLGLLVYETNNFTKFVTQTRKLAARDQVDVVILDHIDLFSVMGQDDKEGYKYMTSMLKTLAMELDIVVICISQMSRLTEFNSGNRMGRLRNSGTKEQDADVVIFLEACKPDGKPFGRRASKGMPAIDAKEEAREFQREYGYVTMKASIEKNREGVTDQCLFRMSWNKGGRIVPIDGSEIYVPIEEQKEMFNGS